MFTSNSSTTVSIVKDDSLNSAFAVSSPGTESATESNGLITNKEGQHKALALLLPPTLLGEDNKRLGSHGSSQKTVSPCPPLGSPGGGSPSLVGIRNNSSKTKAKSSYCTNGSWLVGTCEHSTEHWRYVPCKKRDCEICGPISRYRIAERIALGIQKYWPCAWLVLTFDRDVTKKEAVRKLNVFVKLLRKITAINLQYAATYELTKKGRLHINLIIGPWQYISQGELQKIWRARVSVEWVKNENSIAKETAKSYSPESLGNYLSKLEQAVPTDRRVSYSKNWPKLPKTGLKRKGKYITWLPASLNNELYDKQIVFLSERADYWHEVLPGEWAWLEEKCDCFDIDTS